MYTARDIDVVTSIIRKNIETLRAVYLFGSYAQGTQKKDSDIDVAAIVSDMPRGLEKQRVMNTLYNQFGDKNYTVDVLFKPANEFEKDRNIPVTLSYAIASKGKLLWQKID